MLLPLALLALLGVGVAVAAQAPAQQAPRQPVPPTPTAPPPIPQMPSMPGTPQVPTVAEQQYFDIAPDGLRVWKNPYRAQIVENLETVGIAMPFANDPTVVQLVPRKGGNDATAASWVATMAQTRSILAVKYFVLPLPANTPRFLRAVAPGEELLWAGGAPNAGYAVLQKSGATTPQAPNTPNQTTPNDAFSALGPALAEQVRALYTESTDATKLVVMADALEGKSSAYAPAADRLRARAKELQTAAELRAIQTGRQYVIRSGDLASDLAQWYTGNALKWRELLSTNPQLREMTGDRGDGTKFQYLAPWNAGDKITLPVGWNVDRGLPPRKLRNEPAAT